MRETCLRLVVAALLASSTLASADDTHNLCAAPASHPGAHVSIPADDALHVNSDGTYPYVYEQWYWNAVLVGADAHVYGIETLPWQFNFPWATVTVIQIAVTDATAGTFQSQFVWGAGSYPHVDNQIRLSAADGSGTFQATGASGRDHLTFSFTDGTAVDVTFESLKNPTPAWFDGMASLVDPVTGTSHGTQFYYNRRNMLATGSITRAGRAIAVLGTGWYDREFGDVIGTIGTKANNVHWRWLSMHLSDGTDYMLWDIYANDTGNNLVHVINEIGAAPACAEKLVTTFSYLGEGPTVHSDGPPPSAFDTALHLTIPEEGLDVEVRPLLTNQTIPSGGLFSVFYEGAVTMTGTKNGKRVVGTGYYEQFVEPDGCCQ